MNKNSYEKTISIETFNEIVSKYYRPLEVKQVHASTVMFQIDDCKYYCSLTGEKKDTINVGNIMNQFNRLVEANYELQEGQFGKTTIKEQGRTKRVDWNIEDPGNFWYTDDRRAGKWLKCWSYDLNSAFSYAMTKPMPDTSKEPRLRDLVQENEIGFYSDGGATTKVGAYAEYIFPLMPSPFTKYVENYYNKKQKAKDKNERNCWKKFLNIPSGMLHRKNIFMRNAVLYYAKKHIEEYIDDDTVYCNTDSIISIKPRTDLPISDKIGEFKEEKQNVSFKYLEAGIYQWEQECHYKGIPGIALTDIEKPKDWANNLPYRYDKTLRRIVKNGENK